MYRSISRILTDRLSSVGGFIITYLAAVYIPIYIVLAKMTLPAILIPATLHILSIIYSITKRNSSPIAVNVYASMLISASLLIFKISKLI